LPAAEEMKVQVGHGLSTFGTGVGQEPESPIL
jgi:hypothetical protein